MNDRAQVVPIFGKSFFQGADGAGIGNGCPVVADQVDAAIASGIDLQADPVGISFSCDGKLVEDDVSFFLSLDLYRPVFHRCVKFYSSAFTVRQGVGSSEEWQCTFCQGIVDGDRSPGVKACDVFASLGIYAVDVDPEPVALDELPGFDKFFLLECCFFGFADFLRCQRMYGCYQGQQGEYENGFHDGRVLGCSTDPVYSHKDVLQKLYPELKKTAYFPKDRENKPKYRVRS